MQVRLKGWFSTSKAINWKTNLSKAHKKTEVVLPPVPPPPANPKLELVGRRVVELQLLADGLWCPTCQVTLSLKDTEREELRGLASVFFVRCSKCNVIHEVCTSKSSNTAQNHKIYDVNCKMAIGMSISTNRRYFRFFTIALSYILALL